MKAKRVFICSDCGSIYPKWQGKCDNCGAWEKINEEIQTISKKELTLNKRSISPVYKLSEISTSQNYRIRTNIKEFDRVIGGGIVPGSLVLVGGDPGIGKSTLMLQIMSQLSEFNPIYITGEESLQQIKHRSDRLFKNLKNANEEKISIIAETNLESILAVLKNGSYGIAIIDSIQSIQSDQVDAIPGSINQIRECTNALMQIAKKTDLPIFIIGHVTKDGIIAGPKVLEHIVDTVLQFEGEKTYSYRILRTLKNRFGSTHEIGIFDMDEEGLKEVSNPSEIFLSGRNKEDSGIAIVANIEGSRPILLEVQALVTPSSFSVPQRSCTGYDLRRLQMILAVLEKRLGSKFYKNDVFLNVAGGVYLNDPSVDLGVASALVSSLNDFSIDSQTILIGEVGLTGEVRSVSYIEQRLNEAQKLGFKKAIIPKQNKDKLSKQFDIQLIPVERISVALSMIS